jgi:hypothetical protein
MRVSLAEIKTRPGGKRLRVDHFVEVESLHIGRGPDNDLCLTGLTISLHHATIRIANNHVYIEAASGQTIQINGLPTQGDRLGIGDEVHIGSWVLRRLEPQGDEDLHIEYEEMVQDQDLRAALDGRTRLGIERGLFARRPLSWIAVAAILVGFIGLPLAWPTLRPLWTTGPVVRGHAIIENDCASCHTGLFRGVANESCVACHVEVRRHAPAELAMHRLETLRCAECHSEHRGRNASLAEQGALACVDCHAGLAGQIPGSEIQNVSDFGEHHPELDVMMVMEPGSPPVRMPWSKDLEEHSGVEFDHSMHVAQGVDGPEDEERLACGQCHRLEEDGRQMAPVDFDRDCRRCHALDVGEPELVDRLVHGDPDRAREQLRTFYTDRVLAGRVEDRDAPRRLRTRRAGPLVDAEERTLAANWIGEQVARAEERLFDDDGCAHCHHVEGGFVSQETGDWVPRSVAPVQVMQDWIQHASFDHSKHATEACALCHPAAAIRDGDVEDDPDWARPGAIPYGLIDEATGVTASERSSDVMIPGIATCRGCHVSPDQYSAGKVASPCSMCHAFHDHQLEPMVATMAHGKRVGADQPAPPDDREDPGDSEE